MHTVSLINFLYSKILSYLMVLSTALPNSGYRSESWILDERDLVEKNIMLLKYLIWKLKSEITLLNLMTTAMWTVLNFWSERLYSMLMFIHLQLILFDDQQPFVLITQFFTSFVYREVAGSQMVGVHMTDGKKRFNKPNHDIPSTAETRAKNKACQVRKSQSSVLSPLSHLDWDIGLLFMN